MKEYFQLQNFPVYKKYSWFEGVCQKYNFYTHVHSVNLQKSFPVFLGLDSCLFSLLIEKEYTCVQDVVAHPQHPVNNLTKKAKKTKCYHDRTQQTNQVESTENKQRFENWYRPVIA